MTSRCKIVVVGGGVTGLSVAALLAQSEAADDLAVTLVDAAARPAWEHDAGIRLRVSAVSIGSAALLRDIGAWPAVAAERLCPFDHMRVWDEADAPDSASALRFSADEFAVPHLGYIVENELLQVAILGQLEELGIELRFDAPIEGVVAGNDTGSVQLANGETLEADLIIAADGARSRVRAAAGISLSQHHYDQKAFVTVLTPERSHEDTAWQRFLSDGPLGMLPLADGRISIVWSTRPAAAEAAAASSDKELGKMITAASDAVLGNLEVSGPRGAFPLAAQHASDYVRRGIALIGDAAHTVHPLAGQGANLGLQDAAELAAVIVAALRSGENPADRPVLRRYERARKGANATMMHLMTGLNRLFASDSSIVGEIRRSGMQLFNVSGPVRERMVGVALGAGKR